MAFDVNKWRKEAGITDDIVKTVANTNRYGYGASETPTSKSKDTASSALESNNPAYAALQKYGDGKTGTAANKAVKGTAKAKATTSMSSRFKAMSSALDARETADTDDVAWYEKLLRAGDAGLTRSGQSLVGALDTITSLGDSKDGPLQELWYMIGGDKLSSDNPIRALNKQGQAEVAYREERDKDLQDSLLYKYGGMTTEALAMMAPTLMTGGAATFGKAATEASKLAAASEIGQATSKLGQTAALAKNAVKNFSSRPDAQYIFGTTLGDSYAEAKQDGVDDLQALTYAVLNGAATAASELGGVDIALGGTQSLPQWIKTAIEKGDKSLLLNYAKSIGEEASEEIIQGIMGRGLKSIYKDVPLYDADNPDSVINPSAMAEEATGAAVVAALLGLPTTGINAYYRAKQRNASNTGTAADTAVAQQPTAQSTQAAAANPAQTVSNAEAVNTVQNVGQEADAQTIATIVKAANGVQLTEAEQQILATDPYAQQAVNAITQRAVDNTANVEAGISAEVAQQALDTQMAQRAVAGTATFNPTAQAEGVKAVAQAIAQETEAAPEFIQKVYDLNPQADPIAFKESFKAAYTMGETGGNVEALQHVPTLTQAQARIAYTMGADKAKAATNTQEAIDNGIHLRESSERIDSQNTVGQVSGLAEGTGRNSGGQAQSRPADSTGAAQANGQIVYNGTVQKGVRRTTGKKTSSMRKAAKAAEARGYSVTFFEGGNIKVEGGEARGVVNSENKTVMVRTDHPDFTAHQIMRHELGHADIAEGKESLDSIRKELHKDFTDSELDAMAQAYAEAYEGSGMTAEEAFEEICCDALGEMNIFSDDGREILARYGELLTSAKKSAERQANQGRAPPRDKGVKYSRDKYDYSKSFEKQVDDWMNGKIPKNDSLVIGATPDIFKQVGFNALPMTINQSHVDYAINGTKNSDHHIGAALLKQLPTALENPVAIIASKTKNNTSLVALLPFTRNGQTVVAPVYVDGYGKQNNIVIDSNAVTSIYGRNNAVTTLLTDAINEHNSGKTSLFYIDTAKAAALYRKARVTMPKNPRSRNGFVASIRDESSPVKPKFANVTETQQFKRWFKDSKVVNEDGTPKVVYHQTENDFTVFDIHRGGAGARDNGTPFGIFLKSSNRDIGLKGKKQMALYAKIVNPLRAKDRSEFSRLMRNMSPEYDALITQHEALDREYKSKTQQATKKFKDFIINWRANNPEADSRSLYDVPEFNAIFDAEKTLVDEWTTKADDLTAKAKETMTEALEINGYDGVILENDAGSFGRSTDAYIALHPEQIKSATDNIGTFDANNPDIRHSLEPKKLTELRRENERKLAEATEADAKNENERGLIKTYQQQYSKVLDIEQKLKAAKQELADAEADSTKKDAAIQAQNRVTILNRQYAREHRKLNGYKDTKALQNVLSRVNERTPAKDATHIDNRSFSSVGDRKVKPFQMQHPELHKYYKEMAETVLEDIGMSTLYRTKNGYAKTKFTEDFKRALSGNTFDEGIKALEDIVNDKGSEDYALAKRMEVFLDDLLSNGYTTGTGTVRGNKEYIQAKEKLVGGNTAWENYLEENSLALADGLVTEEELYQEFLQMQSGLPKGMGAASAAFEGTPTAAERWVAQAQAQDRDSNNVMHPISREQEANLAEQQHRAPQEVPKKDPKGKLTSKHVSTIINSGITPAEFSSKMLEDAEQGKFSHIAYSDEEALAKATKKIEADGWENTLAKYKADVNSGKVSKDITVMGIALYNNAVNSEDYATAMDIASLMVKNSKTTAQALQAMRILNRLSPECRLYLAARSVENIQDELNERYKKNKADIHVDKVLYDEYANALRGGEEAKIKEAWAKIEQNVAQQIDATWYEKLNQFRYLAMLGNPRTHIRNIVGNAFFVPVRAVKNTIAYGLETAVDKHVDGGIEKSKAILKPSNANDAALIKYANLDYDSVQDAIMGGGKYIDTFQGVDKHRTIYKKAKALEKISKGNSKLLDREDAWFCKPAYAHALAKWYKANGISAEQLAKGEVDEETITKAQATAIKEAQKATYRDLNWFSEHVNMLNRVKNKPAKILVEGLMPFKKTPANIFSRALEYSPAGLIKTLAVDTKKLKTYVNGDVENGMSPAQYIDNMASGLTGSALMGLGVLLASMGVLSGGDGEDEKQNNFNELKGGQNYALNIGGMSITLDWLAPESMPLFVGVELFNSFRAENEDNDALTNFISSLMDLADPMLEMSMLQSVSDLFDNLQNIEEGHGIYRIVSGMATSYITQYFPTLFGQVERAFTEEERETTYIDRNSKANKELRYLLAKIANKIPGYDYSQIPYIDAWGRRESTGNLLERTFNNFLNPAYVKEERNTPIDSELERLYELGETSVYPTRAATNTQINGKYLTADEYVTYATEKGQISYNMAEQIINSSDYRSATDGEKAYMIETAYRYANNIAKYKVNNDFEVNGKWIMTAYDSGNPAPLIIAHAMEWYKEPGE